LLGTAADDSADVRSGTTGGAVATAMAAVPSVGVADTSFGNRIDGRVISSPPITRIAAKMTATWEE
jgi:hypothetical protein